MIFVHSGVLTLLVLVPLAVPFLLWRGRIRARKLRRVGDIRLLGELSSGISRARRVWKAALWAAAVAALIVALARPVWGVDAEVIEAEGVAVIVVLDVSASMDAGDTLPSRLERAKLDIHDLYLALEGNEVGLVVFAGDAFVQFPLTVDVNSAETFLNGVSSGSITRQGTALEAGMRLAIESFDERIAAHSIIVVVSDGENQAGDPLLAAQDAAERGIVVHALGYGGLDGAPVPMVGPDGVVSYKADRAGDIVLSRLNELILQVIADTTGGLYQRAGQSGNEIIHLASRINSIEGEVLERQMADRPVERFGIFVALALLALSAEMLLPEARGKAG